MGEALKASPPPKNSTKQNTSSAVRKAGLKAWGPLYLLSSPMLRILSYFARASGSDRISYACRTEDILALLRSHLAPIRSPLALIRSLLALIRSPLTLIRSLLTLMNSLLTLMRSLLTLMRSLLTLMRSLLTLIRSLLVSS
jgi:hypothetical protein